MKVQLRFAIPLLLSSVLVILLVVLLVWLMRGLDFEATMISLLHHADSAGIIGQIIVIVIGAVSVITLIPSVILTLAAGFLYGAFYGSILIIVGETIGAVLAFGIARSGLMQKWTQQLRSSNSLKMVNVVLQTSGWELVAAIRMIPFFPFKLSNYLFGLSPVRLKHFVIGTMIGLWPITFFNTYIGSMAGGLMSLGIPERERTTAEWIVLVAGFVVVLLFVVYAITRAKRLVRLHQ